MPSKSDRVLWLYLFVLGFSAIFFQIYLLRECMTIFNGNELVIGIVLAGWMLLTGTGAFLGRFFGRIRGKAAFLVFLMLLFSVLPILTVLKLYFWRAVALPYGSMAGLTQIIGASLSVQVPFCLLNGFLFSSFTLMLSGTDTRDLGGRSYAVESLGSLAAGLIVNLILLWFLDIWQSLKILLWLNLASAVIFSWIQAGKRSVWLTFPIAFILALAPVFLQQEWVTSRILYPGQEIAFDRSTPYGRVTVTENAGQLNFYENGLLLFSSGNEILNEELVHFAMVQNAHPDKVLLIGGGISGSIQEILKYHPSRIDYSELNPAVIEAGKTFASLPESKAVHVFTGDARIQIKKSIVKYDVAIISLPEPSTLQINRFYTQEFFEELKGKMECGGVVSLSLPLTADYVSPVAAKLNSVMNITLKKLFRNVLILPGQKNYFIASDTTLHTDVASRLMEKGIPTLYVNPYYFDDQLLKDRSSFIQKKILPDSKPNLDFHPRAFFYQLQYWTTYFNPGYILISIIVLLILVLVALTLNPLSQGLFTAGFTGSSLQILSILAFQVIFGYVFSAVGILITLFMAGLFAGSWFRRKIYAEPTLTVFLHLQLTLAFFSIGFPFILLALDIPGMPVLFIRIIFGLLIFVAAFLSGLEFSTGMELSRKDFAKAISGNYSADMFGAALGAILTAVILLPFLGLILTCLLLGLLNFLSAGFLFILPKKSVTLPV